MRVLCAPDSYKESISAAEAAEAMARGIRQAGAGITADVCPIADGGEGTLDALIGALGGEIRTATVTGPLGEPVSARYGITADATGVVELAEASGLVKVPKDKRDPTKTTTYGTGELIRLAADAGCNTVIVCIGGSATVDGAAGLTQALGGRFFGTDSRLIDKPITGGMLSSITRFEPPSNLPRIRICCDVTNPLCGTDGAAAVYAPQKGATPEQVRQLDAALAHLAELTNANPDMPGFGSAGGAGFGLATMCGAHLERGIDLVMDAVGFQERCRRADLVLTGEGQIDAQTLSGKASLGVAEAARKLGRPVIAIAGRMGEGAEACLAARGGPFDEIITLADRYGVQRSMGETAALLAETAGDVARHYVSGRSAARRE